MIHNLILEFVKGGANIHFTFISEIGKAKCKVDTDKKCWVTDYEVLGQPYDEKQQSHIEGIRRMSNNISDICDCNGWINWSN